MVVIKKLNLALLALSIAAIPTYNRCDTPFMTHAGAALVTGVALYPLIGIAKTIQGYFSGSTHSALESISRATTPEEEAFFRQYIPADATVKIIPDFASAFQFKNFICIGEKTTHNGQNIVTLSEALKNNDADALKIFAGLAEHEYGHFKHNHKTKELVTGSITSIACAALGALLAYKVLPVVYYDHLSYRLGLADHVPVYWSLFGLCLATATAYAWLIPALITRFVNYRHEYQADKNISPEHRKHVGMFLVLRGMALQQPLWFNSHTHPSILERTKYLFA